MTAPHIVDPGTVLAEALAEASPDLMRQLLQKMINALLSADADAVVGAEWGGTIPGPHRAAQRLSAPRAGHPGRHDRCRDPEAPFWHLLPRVAAAASQTLRGGARHRRRGLLPRRRQHASDGQAGEDPRHSRAVEVAGVPDGGRPRRAGRRLPASVAGRGWTVHIRGR